MGLCSQFAVCDNVAPWNRHQERRSMSGLQGPQPSLLSKIPYLWMLQWLWINVKKTNVVSFIATFGERKSLGKFHLDNETEGPHSLLSSHLVSIVKIACRAMAEHGSRQATMSMSWFIEFLRQGFRWPLCSLCAAVLICHCNYSLTSRGYSCYCRSLPETCATLMKRSKLLVSKYTWVLVEEWEGCKSHWVFMHFFWK